MNGNKKTTESSDFPQPTSSTKRGSSGPGWSVLSTNRSFARRSKPLYGERPRGNSLFNFGRRGPFGPGSVFVHLNHLPYQRLGGGGISGGKFEFDVFVEVQHAAGPHGAQNLLLIVALELQLPGSFLLE